MDDKSLLRGLKRGDDEALNAIISRYSAYVYAIASNMLRDRMGTEDVEEVASEVFFSLWQKRKQITPVSLQAYLAAMTRNITKNKMRALKLTLPLEDDVLSIQVPEGQIDEELFRKELRQTVRNAVDNMEEPDREIFVRYYFYYQKISEIAAEMDLNDSVVRTRLHRGRKKLQAWLAERGYLHETANL